MSEQRDERPFPEIQEDIYMLAGIDLRNPSHQPKMVRILRGASEEADRDERDQATRARISVSFISWAAAASATLMASVVLGAWKWLVARLGNQ